MTTIQIGKKGLLLFLLWLRGPLRLILSIIMLMCFATLVGFPIAIQFSTASWSPSLIYFMIQLFIASFGSFLLMFYYEKLIRYLQ
ncbi:hypothetical protein MCY_01708 [Bartonella rattimassiliensis 15908]|uniref:ABC transmembrane type-1 domain-containing protein n=1 Tax=Bartonella rattimassiliensis 15908 TaxID=1094556 RepID=J0QBF1_9HYPH|nr:hypothetical protein MCY_01708 [Bartonella rattimassiliensis 15908]